MEIELSENNSIVYQHFYVVRGTSGSISYDGSSYNIDESFQATEESSYTKVSGDAYLTEQFRLYGVSLENLRQQDERLDSVNDLPNFKFSGIALEARRQRDELITDDVLRQSGISLEFHPSRYITTLKRRKYQE